jgi:S-adenosylmethionine synthetase
VLSFAVETFGTGRRPAPQIEMDLQAEFELTPAGIIRHLDLLRPIYRQTAAYGHFGRSDLSLPWERVV